MYDFVKEMSLDVKAQSSKSTREGILVKLLKSPGLMISASSIPITVFLPCDPNELCNQLKLLLQEKHAGKNPDIINKEIVVIVDNLSEYQSISKKQPKQNLFKCNLLHKKKK